MQRTIIHSNFRRERYVGVPTQDLRKEASSIKYDLRWNLDRENEEDEDEIEHLEQHLEDIESELFEREITLAIPNSTVVVNTDKGICIAREINWKKMQVRTLYGWSKWTWIVNYKSMKAAQAQVGV